MQPSSQTRARTRLLRAQAAEVASEWRAHRKVCYDCRPAQDDTLFWCDEGWAIAKAARRADALLAEDQAAEDHPGPGLW